MRTDDNHMPAAFCLFGGHAGEVPRLRESMCAVNSVGFASGGEKVGVEDVEGPDAGDLNADAAGRLAGEPVVDEWERRAVQEIWRDKRRDDRMARNKAESGSDRAAA